MTMQSLNSEDQERDLSLEGAVASFVDPKTFFIVLKDGTVYPVEIIMDGRIVSGLSMGTALTQTTIPTTMMSVVVDERRFLFVGCFCAAEGIQDGRRSSARREKRRRPRSSRRCGAYDGFRRRRRFVPSLSPFVCLTKIRFSADIYGDIEMTQSGLGQLPNGHSGTSLGTAPIVVSHCRPMDRYLTWPSLSLGMGWVHLAFHFDYVYCLTFYLKEKPATELITVTGYGRLGGFTYLIEEKSPYADEKESARCGRSKGRLVPTKSPDRLFKCSFKLFACCNATRYGLRACKYRRNSEPRAYLCESFVSCCLKYFVSIDHFSVRCSHFADSVTITTRITDTTIGAAPFFQRTAIVHITAGMIRVLEPGD